MYMAVAEKQGGDLRKLRGTIQNDILKEYIARGTYIFPPRRPCASSPTSSPSATSSAPVEHHQHQRLPHPRGRLHRGAGSGLHPGQRHRLRGGGHQAAGLDVDEFGPRAVLLLQRPHGFPGGSRQVPGRPAPVGQDHEGALQGRGPKRSRCCASTPRPPAARSPPSSRTTTSCASPRRPWPRCWAGPSPCTPTPATRPWPCPPRTGGADGPAHPADHRLRDAASPTPSTPWPAPTTWKP